jgi:hypothetical protein
VVHSDVLVELKKNLASHSEVLDTDRFADIEPLFQSKFRRELDRSEFQLRGDRGQPGEAGPAPSSSYLSKIFRSMDSPEQSPSKEDSPFVLNPSGQTHRARFSREEIAEHYEARKRQAQGKEEVRKKTLD